MMQIKTSLDWNNVEIILLRKTHGLTHELEIKKMVKNIRAEITELSKAEVEFRRRKRNYANELLLKINQDIEVVEEFLLIAALIG